MSSKFAVELSNVDKVFHTHHFFMKDEESGRRPFHTRKTVNAVNKVDFGIAPGEIFGLLGPNGAGKTTCVKMVSGLVRPTAGKVYVDGMHVERQRLKVLRQVGVVLEGTRTVIWPLTPLENLKYFGTLRGVPSRVLRARAHELIDFIGLKDKMHVQVRRLSRGQRQRLAICIALVNDPAVILLDEPTTGLDVQSSRAIREKVRQMTRELGKSVLVTTHDMAVAQEICDRIGIIDKGRLIACKPTRELISVFSDQVYDFELDRMPEIGAIERIAGVHSATVHAENGTAPLMRLRVSDDETERSKALYETIGLLHAQGFVLRGVSRHEQTLEDVFLRLTETTV